MLEIIRSTFENTIIDELDIEIRLGLLNKTIYKPTTTPLEESYINPILQTIVNNIVEKLANEEMNEMIWEDYSSKSYNYIMYDEEHMYNPLTDEQNIAVEPRGYNEVTKKNGDIIILEVSIKVDNIDKNYVVYVENDQVGALHKGLMCKLIDNPTVISNEDVIMINPARLIAIFDVNNQLLIIKNNIRAKTLFALSEYYRNKAKEILSELVINAESLSENLTDEHIKVVLSNKRAFSREFFEMYSESYIGYLHEIGIGTFASDEHDLVMVDINSNNLEEYISKVPAYTKRNNISQEEEIVEAL